MPMDPPFLLRQDERDPQHVRLGAIDDRYEVTLLFFALLAERRRENSSDAMARILGFNLAAQTVEGVDRVAEEITAVAFRVGPLQERRQQVRPGNTRRQRMFPGARQPHRRDAVGTEE